MLDDLRRLVKELNKLNCLPQLNSKLTGESNARKRGEIDNKQLDLRVRKLFLEALQYSENESQSTCVIF